MTQSLSMTCEGLEERSSSTSRTCTFPARQDAGYGSRPLTGTNLGRSGSRLIGGGGMTSRASTPQSRTFGRQTNYLIFCTHNHIWNWSMETPPHSSEEEERLKRENAILRSRIVILEAEVQRLKAKTINVWGDS